MTLQTTKLSPQGGTARDIATAVNQALDGKLACVGTAAIPSGSTQLQVVDPLVTAGSAVLLVPTTVDARDATVAITDGSFTVTFAFATTGVGTLTYAVLG